MAQQTDGAFSDSGFDPSKYSARLFAILRNSLYCLCEQCMLCFASQFFLVKQPKRVQLCPEPTASAQQVPLQYQIQVFFKMADVQCLVEQISENCVLIQLFFK